MASSAVLRVPSLPAVTAAYLVVAFFFLCAFGCVFLLLATEPLSFLIVKAKRGIGITDVFVLLCRGELMTSLFNKGHFHTVKYLA